MGWIGGQGWLTWFGLLANERTYFFCLFSLFCQKWGSFDSFQDFLHIFHEISVSSIDIFQDDKTLVLGGLEVVGVWACFSMYWGD